MESLMIFANLLAAMWVVCGIVFCGFLALPLPGRRDNVEKFVQACFISPVAIGLPACWLIAQAMVNGWF